MRLTYIILFLFCFVMPVSASQHVYAQTASSALEAANQEPEKVKKTDSDIDKETKERIDTLIKELDGKTRLNVDAMEMLRKGGHVDTLEWIAAELEKKEGLRFLDDETKVDNIIGNMDHLIADDKFLGLYYMRQSGFDDRLWTGYTKKTLNEHIDALHKKTNLPYAFLDQLRLMLLTKAKQPKGYNKLNFATWRLQTLLDFGFRQEALSFYTYLSLYYETKNKEMDQDLLRLGLTSYLINRKFDGACLEYNVHVDLIKNLSEENTFLKTVAALCDTYLDENSDAPESVTFKLNDYIQDDHVSLLPFMYMLAANGDIALKVEDFSFKSLPLASYIKLAGLLEAKNMPANDKKTIFKALLIENRLSVATLLRLFKHDASFISWANQKYYQAIEKTPSAFEKLKLIEKQIKLNRIPHNPLSNLYYRFIHPIKPNEAFKDSARFVSYYLYMNDSYSKARKWAQIESDLPSEFTSVPPKNPTEDAYYEKNNSFFIFPLAYWSRIMLKSLSSVNTETNSVETSLQNLRLHWLDLREKQSINNGEIPTSDVIKTLFDKRLSSDEKRLISRFEDTAGSKEKAKTVIMSVLIWDMVYNKVNDLATDQQNMSEKETNKEETLGQNDDLTKIVKFILHSLRKSDLNNYALAFGLDIASLYK